MNGRQEEYYEKLHKRLDWLRDLPDEDLTLEMLIGQHLLAKAIPPHWREYLQMKSHRAIEILDGRHGHEMDEQDAILEQQEREDFAQDGDLENMSAEDIH